MDINKIASIIKEGLSEYQTKEEIIKEEIASMDVEYATQNERPIAAFMTEYLAKELTTKDNEIISFHELPIKGLNEERVDEIKKEFLKNSKISMKSIKKKYKSYNIDGFLKFDSKEGSSINNVNPIFIEYKVNKTFKFIDLAQDFLKFLIYSSESSKNQNFIYVVFFKDGDTFTEINETDLKLSTSLKNDSNFGNTNIFWFESSSKQQDKMQKLETNLIALEVLGEISDSTPTIINQSEYDQFKDSLALKNITIYGHNVFFSKKMMRNYSKILKIKEKLSQKSIGREASNTDQNNYNEIKGFIKKVRNSKEASDTVTDSKKRVIKQMTNWVLSIIQCMADEYNIENKFDIGTAYMHGASKSKQNMNQSFSEMVEYSKKLLRNVNAKTMAYKIIRHITDVYQITYDCKDLSENSIPKINEKYETFQKIEKESNNLKKIHETLLNCKSDKKLILNIKDFAEEVSKQKLLSVITKNI